MTIAVCVRCGAEKFGAFNPCECCGFLPRSDEDLATSLALTDHYLNKDARIEYSAKIRGGAKLDLDLETKEKFLEAVRNPNFRKAIGLDSATSRVSRSPSSGEVPKKFAKG